MNSKVWIVVIFCLFVGACGYGREDDKEVARQEDIKELSEEMSQTLTTISSLKIQLRDSLDDLSTAGDSIAQVKADKYRLLLAELDKVETTYEEWQEEVNTEPANITHEEAMEYYDQQEEKAQTLRMDMRQAIEYVQEELQAPVVDTP